MLDTQALTVDDLCDTRYLRPVYQPIVDLQTREVVGVEALARWPGLSTTPEEAFRLAHQEGRLADLDAACQEAAIGGAANNLADGAKLFVNLEASALSGDSAERIVAWADGRVGLVVEITERALLSHPAELLRAVDRLRRAGCLVALDDVGAAPQTLALLPLVAPDVIKLDLSLVQGWPTTEQAAILTAVSAHVERTGATVLAEGIENEAHLAQAISLGATLGQGWYFARPGPIEPSAKPQRPLRRLHRNTETVGTPFELLHPRQILVAAKGMLMGITLYLEEQGYLPHTPPLVLATFQDRDRFTSRTAERYARLATRCPMVVALGGGLDPEPVPNVRGAHLPPTDRLRGEWTVVVVGPHHSAALIAQDLGDEGPDMQRRFAYGVTHDHDTVIAAARCLLGRVAPLELLPY